MTRRQMEQWMGTWSPTPTPVNVSYGYDTITTDRSNGKTFDISTATNSYTTTLNTSLDSEEIAKRVQEQLEKQYILERRPINVDTYKGAPIVKLDIGRNAAFLMSGNKEILELRDIKGLEIEQHGGWNKDVELRIRACSMKTIPVTPSGFIKDKESEKPKSYKEKIKPKKTIFNGPATTIIWTDGTKTTVKCQEGDSFEAETGIAMCYLKRLFGNEGNYNHIFRDAFKVADWQFPEDKHMTDKDVEVATAYLRGVAHGVEQQKKITPKPVDAKVAFKWLEDEIASLEKNLKDLGESLRKASGEKEVQK